MTETRRRRAAAVHGKCTNWRHHRLRAHEIVSGSACRVVLRLVTIRLDILRPMIFNQLGEREIASNDAHLIRILVAVVG